MKTRLLLCLLTLVTDASAEEALEIVKRSLPFVKEKGVAWATIGLLEWPIMPASTITP